MAQLPLGSFAPELLVEAALTRSGIPENYSPRYCHYLKKENAYQVFAPAGDHVRRILLDPSSLAPLLIEGFEGVAWNAEPAAAEVHISARPTWKLVFSDFQGADWATLPKTVEAYQGQQRQWTYRWKEAERWNDFREAAFLWQPAASMSLKDY